MAGVPDLLTCEEIIPVLKTHYIGREILHYDTADSTNNIARKKAAEGCMEGMIVTAEEQTSGKGRLGRKWETPKGGSITFSLVLRPNMKPADVPGVTLVMGTAVCRALRNFTSLDVGIKWPNDIIINGKKVCGILTEMSSQIERVNYIVVGVGINVNINKFPEELRNIATSLYIELGSTISRREVLAQVLFEFENLYGDFKLNGICSIIDEFKALSVTLGRMVKVISANDEFEGEAVDITRDGILVVKNRSGEIKKVISGDVSVRGLNGYI